MVVLYPFSFQNHFSKCCRNKDGCCYVNSKAQFLFRLFTKFFLLCHRSIWKTSSYRKILSCKLNCRHFLVPIGGNGMKQLFDKVNGIQFMFQFLDFVYTMFKLRFKWESVHRKKTNFRLHWESCKIYPSLQRIEGIPVVARKNFWKKI